MIVETVRLSKRAKDQLSQLKRYTGIHPLDLLKSRLRPLARPGP